MGARVRGCGRHVRRSLLDGYIGRSIPPSRNVGSELHSNWSAHRMYRAISTARGWCSRGSSSGATIHHPEQTPAGRQGPVTVPCLARRRTVDPLPMRAVAHPVHEVTRHCGDRATKRLANWREAGGAPAIGIEARKGRDPASPGLGAKHESPGPTGHRSQKRNRRGGPQATARADRGDPCGHQRS